MVADYGTTVRHAAKVLHETVGWKYDGRMPNPPRSLESLAVMLRGLEATSKGKVCLQVEHRMGGWYAGLSRDHDTEAQLVGPYVTPFAAGLCAALADNGYNIQETIWLRPLHAPVNRGWMNR